MRHKLAIDFGTTNSVIARWDETTAQGQTLAIPPMSAATGSGAFLIPTLLYVRDGRTSDIVMGEAVRAQGLDRQPGQRLFRNFKRVLNAPSIFDARLIDGVPWTEAQVGQIFLRRLLEALPYHADEIDQLVITVPVAAYDGYTDWLSQAVAHLPAEKIRVVDESTAAALGYAITTPGALVLVIDCGGGTLDLSLVRLPKNHPPTKAQVIAKVGVALGGADIDQWVLHAVLRRLKLSIEALGPAYPQWLGACERAKIILSTATETTLALRLETGQSFSIALTRAEVEALMTQNGFFDALTRALEKVMGYAAQHGVYREDLQDVVMVGGTALIPAVQQTLDAYFRAITQRQRKGILQMPVWPAATWQVENTTLRVDKPFTAVVEGALQVAIGAGLTDQLAHGYGLQYLDAMGAPQFDEIIPVGSTYPSAQLVRVTLGASRAQQAAVEIVIGQITTEATDAPLTRIVPLAPLRVPLAPLGQLGSARLVAEFRVDAARHLHVAISDLKTRQVLLPDGIVRALGASTTEVALLESTTISGAAPTLVQAHPTGLRHFAEKIRALFYRLVPIPVSGEAYLAALRSDDSLTRFDAAQTLARRGDREARLLFETILHTSPPHQRASVARHLYRFSWFAAEPLFQHALNDSDSRVREAAVLALCKMRLPQAYALVSNVLPNSSDALRLAAVWGLHNHPDPAAVPVLALTLQAHDPEIRTLTLEVLGATEAPAAIAVVKTALADSVPEVQYAAVLSWVELAHETCLADIAHWIEHTHGWSRYWIVRGFFHATNYMQIALGATSEALTVIQALTAALNDDLAAARVMACFALAWMRHPQAESALLAGYRRETEADAKAQMLNAAVHLMSPCAPTLLTEAQQDVEQGIRQTADFLLKSHTPPLSVEQAQ